MKKLVLLLAVVFSASLFSCNNSAKEAEATDSIAADTVEVAVVEDTVAAVDSIGDTTVVAETAAAVVAQ